jgi:GDP-L-fucose synthase
MVGSAVVRRLLKAGFQNLILRTSKELDLTRQAEVEKFFLNETPEYVFLAAARVGGIVANKTYRAEFIYNNLQIQNNVIHNAYQTAAKKLVFFSSSCVYPRMCPQPMKEEHLWTGILEPTNEPYAVAKLAGMSMCRAYNDQHGTHFISAIPPNLYGPNDNFDPLHSHVMAALIQKFHRAKTGHDKEVMLWGTGAPRRELMFVDDAADASLFLMQHYDATEPVNVGLGSDHTICELASLVKQVVGYEGKIVFDSTKPDGTPQKLLDGSRLHALGWQAQTTLEDGITKAYESYLRSLERTTPILASQN